MDLCTERSMNIGGYWQTGDKYMKLLNTESDYQSISRSEQCTLTGSGYSEFQMEVSYVTYYIILLTGNG